MKNLALKSYNVISSKVYLTVMCLLLFGINYNASANTGQLIVAGKVINSKETECVIRSNDGTVRHIISIRDGIFRDTIEIQTGYYIIGVKTEYADLFLQPGADVHIEIDMNEFDESISFSGKGSPENNFLAQSYLRYEAAQKKLGNISEVSEENYVKFLNSHLAEEKYYLSVCIPCSETFREFHLHHLKIKRAQDLKSFPFVKAMFSGSREPITLSESYPDPFEGIDLDNPELLMVPGFIDVVLSQIEPEVKRLIQADSTRDYGVTLLEVAKTNISNELIREGVAYNTFNRLIDHSSQKQKLYDMVITSVKKQAYVDQINASYSKWTSITKGMSVPEFEFSDSKGEKFKLSDFQGKYVLIDIWATWCMPCLAEVPAFNELHDTFENSEIVFVGLAWQDAKDKWLKKIESGSLKGIQLYADNSNHDFFKTLIVKSIPRYILLDKEGKLLDHDAPRPSGGKLEEVLESLLSK